MNEKTEYALATFGCGCFWCTEAIFRNLDGVVRAVSGYSGGHIENPAYEDVCAGVTGHAESVQITYDPARVSYTALLEVFWKTHNPTTRNRQGNDIGTQYRSVVFYHDAKQKELAESYKDRLEPERIWSSPIVTEIEPYNAFWPAEPYHQDYYENNRSNNYCIAVITPKIEKLRHVFTDRLKK